MCNNRLGPKLVRSVQQLPFAPLRLFHEAVRYLLCYRSAQLAQHFLAAGTGAAASRRILSAG